MKKLNLLKVGLVALFSIISLSGCSKPAIDPSEDEHHVHVFDQQVATIRYRATPSSCGHAATYYYSCICGEKGTETFEYGEAKEHTYKLVILSGQANYLIGQVFDVSSISAKLQCQKCEHEEDVDNSSLIVDQTPLTKDITSVTIGVRVNNELVQTNFAVNVDIYRINNVDIYENNDHRIMYSLSGEYGDGYESKISGAELYLSPNGDLYKYSSTSPIVTPDSPSATHGTFKAELDITEMPFSSRENIVTVNNDCVYWPHFKLENDQGVMEDKEIRLPNLEMKEVAREGDPSGESYILNLYNDPTLNKSIPVVGRATTNPVPSFQYYYTQTDTTYEFPSEIERGYMPVSVDIENVNDRAIWSISGKFKGYTRMVDLFRCFSIYFYRYPSNSSATAYYKGFSGGNSNHFLMKDDFVFNLLTEDTGTFTFKLDITNFGISDATRPGYWTRLSDTSNEGHCDAKNADSINDGKAITIGSKVYTIINVDPSVTPTKANSWGTMGFKITAA